MKISLENARLGNRAMASVLLLYYHLVSEGGITNDQTIYLDPDDFEASRFIDVEVEDGLEIDEGMLREGACICALCDLDDLIAENSDFHALARTRELLALLQRGAESVMPELGELVAHLARDGKAMDWPAYLDCRRRIFERYVLERWRAILATGEARRQRAARAT